MNMIQGSLTNVIINAFYEVYNKLGYGFLEKVYRNALYFELKDRGLKCELEKRIIVNYKYYEVGDYYADIVVEDSIILELKSIENLGPAQEAQLINYLRSTNIEVGLLLNFGPKAEFRRKIMSNIYKDYKKYADNKTEPENEIENDEMIQSEK